MGGDLHGRRLVIEQPVAEDGGDLELVEAGAGLTREVPRHLQVDVVRRNQLLARPALLDDLRQLLGDVDAVGVVPTILEPGGELVGGVLVQHVDVQLALSGKAGERQVATPQIGDLRDERVVAVEEVELGVQRMAEEQLDDDLAGTELGREPLQPSLVLVSRRADGQLLPHLLRQPDPEAMGGAVVHARRPAADTRSTGRIDWGSSA